MKKVTIKKVLFVCIENSCRSQLAEAITNHFFSNKLEAFSAGSNPSKKINPKAISSLKRIQIIHFGYNKTIDEMINKSYDFVVGMGCGDRCPIIPGAKKLEWDIPDPKTFDNIEFDNVRDLIKDKIISDLILL